MPSKLEELKAKALARRHALAANLGLDSAAQLTEALHSKTERRKLLDEKSQLETRSQSPVRKEKLEEPKQEKKDEYTDSSTFLKGTNSNNPHNDYCQNFIDTGQVILIVGLYKSFICS